MLNPNDDNDVLEFETVGLERPVHALREGVSFAQLQNGVEFEIDEQNDEEEFETGENDLWWSKEELIKHLEKNPDSEGAEFAEGEISFEELSKEMMPLTEDGKVRKRIVRTGVGPEIGASNSISYHCEAYLDNADTPFDSTILRGKPFLHRLDSDPILPGLHLALQTMRKFESAQILVSPEYAFGELGCPPRVPENATILYRVEILTIYQEGTLENYLTLPDEERQRYNFETVLGMCNTERVSGNSYFENGKYKEALRRYRKAVQVLERFTYRSDADNVEANNVLLKLYCNAANACNKIQKPIIAMSYCKRALVIKPDHLKALYQYAKAKFINGNYAMAKDILLKAQKIEPGNTSVSGLLRKLEERVRLDEIAEEECYRRMANFFRQD